MLKTNEVTESREQENAGEISFIVQQLATMQEQNWEGLDNNQTAVLEGFIIRALGVMLASGGGATRGGGSIREHAESLGVAPPQPLEGFTLDECSSNYAEYKGGQ